MVLVATPLCYFALYYLGLYYLVIYLLSMSQGWLPMTSGTRFLPLDSTEIKVTPIYSEKRY